MASEKTRRSTPTTNGKRDPYVEPKQPVGPNPPPTALAEVDTAPVPGFGPRGSDIDSQGVVWVSLGSAHLDSFDRRKCEGPLDGRIATTPTADGNAAGCGAINASARPGSATTNAAACDSSPVVAQMPMPCSVASATARSAKARARSKSR